MRPCSSRSERHYLWVSARPFNGGGHTVWRLFVTLRIKMKSRERSFRLWKCEKGGGFGSNLRSFVISKVWFEFFEITNDAEKSSHSNTVWRLFVTLRIKMKSRERSFRLWKCEKGGGFGSNLRSFVISKVCFEFFEITNDAEKSSHSMAAAV